MNIGIFSGSFNPIHHGHLMIANYMVEYADLEEVWFLVSPQNPMKLPGAIEDRYHRLKMVEQAIDGFARFRASDFEFDLPLPNYTFTTLQTLKESYPEHTFSLIIGSDNWSVFEKWYRYVDIITHFRIYVFERRGYPIHIGKYYRRQVEVPQVPLIEISSTFIRESIALGKDVRAFLPKENWKYIQEHRLYVD